MIFHDRVRVLRRVLVGYDAHGNPRYQDQEHPYRAEVRPLSTKDSSDPASSTVITRFRVFLPASASGLVGTDALTWRGASYEIEGTVEPHTINGRLHHYEVLVKRAS